MKGWHFWWGMLILAAGFALALVIIQGILSQDETLEIMYDEGRSEVFGDRGFKIVYEAGPYELKQFLEDSRILVDTANGLNTQLHNPPDILVRFTKCDTANAFYNPEAKDITLCYELLQDVVQMHKGKTLEELKELLNQTVHFLFFHEVGHVLIHRLDIPVTGREEDAVDQLAIGIFAEQGIEEGLVASALFFQARMENRKKTQVWNEHALDAQRYYNILCWAYGKDPEKYKRAITQGGLPEKRAERCEWEYHLLSKSWKRLLEPHVKP